MNNKKLRKALYVVLLFTALFIGIQPGDSVRALTALLVIAATFGIVDILLAIRKA